MCETSGTQQFEKRGKRAMLECRLSKTLLVDVEIGVGSYSLATAGAAATLQNDHSDI